MRQTTGKRGRYNMSLSPAQRFEMKVDRTGECHRWTGAHDRAGYGSFWYEHRARGAHVVALILTGVEIPADKMIDHVWARGCKHRDCVRVDHLEVVTAQENILRGGNPAAINARKQVCNRGHEFSPNPYNCRGDRRCLTCDEIRRAARRKNHGSAAATHTPPG